MPYQMITHKDGSVTPLFDKEWLATISMATTMFEGYTQWVEESGEDLTLEVLGLELEVAKTYVLKDGTSVRLLGHTDMLVREAGKRLGIIDHKSRDASKWKGPRPGDFQLLTYALLVSHERGEHVHFAAHNMLKRSKRTARANPPFYARMPINISPQALEQHDNLLRRVLSQMVRTHRELSTTPHVHYLRAPANMTGECGWSCRVKEVCDLMHDPNIDWRDFANEHYPATEAGEEGEPNDD
jgi:hypothetical protein